MQLLKLLNKQENLNLKDYQEELSINTYITLLSLSNLEYSEDIDGREKEEISDLVGTIKINEEKTK